MGEGRGLTAAAAAIAWPQQRQQQGGLWKVGSGSGDSHRRGDVWLHLFQAYDCAHVDGSKRENLRRVSFPHF